VAFTGTDTFNVQGASIAKNAATMSLGTQLKVNKNTHVELNYTGVAAHGMKENGVQANLIVKF
jgi:uncharacterized protein with beta-barrel porin domain